MSAGPQSPHPSPSGRWCLGIEGQGRTATSCEKHRRCAHWIHTQRLRGMPQYEPIQAPARACPEGTHAHYQPVQP